MNCLSSLMTFLFLSILAKSILATRTETLPNEHNVKDPPTPSPTIAPTIVPTSLPTSSPITSYQPPLGGATGCHVNTNGEYGITQNTDSQINIEFNYELRFNEGNESQLLSLVDNVEKFLTDNFIRNVFEECMRRRLSLRHLSNSDNVDLSEFVVGFSEKPFDYILQGT